MKVYTNSTPNFSIDDHECIDETFETFIYTQHGIYKKYKKHFFLCEYRQGVPKTDVVNYKQREYLIQEDELKINKQKLLTSIPFQCYFVNRTIRKYCLENDVIFVKEIDNDQFESCYFVVDLNDKLKYISLYVK